MRRRRGTDILTRGALLSALLGGAHAAVAQDLAVTVSPSPTNPTGNVVVSTTLGGGASAQLERRNLPASINWRTFHKMGWEALRSNDLALAESLFRAGVKEAERLGTKDPRLANSYNDLGWLYFQKGRPEEAKPLVRWALDTRIALRGAIHPEVGDSLILMAKINTALKEYDEAEQAARSAMSIYFHSSTGWMDRHPPFAIDVLGEVAEARGDLEQAQAHYQRAMDLRQFALGVKFEDLHEVEMEDLSASYRRLASVLRKQGQAEAADRFEQMAENPDLFAEDGTPLSGPGGFGLDDQPGAGGVMPDPDEAQFGGP